MVLKYLFFLKFGIACFVLCNFPIFVPKIFFCLKICFLLCIIICYDVCRGSQLLACDGLMAFFFSASQDFFVTALK